jgi:crotonobetainyl-CoA:carnitine CoA-transferase CaiB-like acyl-CoA transferase
VARQVFFDLDGGPGVGAIRQIRTPVGTPDRVTMPPKLGQHTREVLQEFGLSEAEITALV